MGADGTGFAFGQGNPMGNRRKIASGFSLLQEGEEEGRNDDNNAKEDEEGRRTIWTAARPPV